MKNGIKIFQSSRCSCLRELLGSIATPRPLVELPTVYTRLCLSVVPIVPFRGCFDVWARRFSSNNAGFHQPTSNTQVAGVAELGLPESVHFAFVPAVVRMTDGLVTRLVVPHVRLLEAAGIQYFL